jgi:hypothetical protein
MKMLLAAAAPIAIGLALIVVACGTGSSGKAESKPNTSTTTRSGPENEVTGFGATNEAWESAHTQVPGFAEGAVYDADPSLPKVNGHTGTRYSLVEHDDGFVLSYMYSFTARSISAARADVLRTQLPSDARVVWFKKRGRCDQMMVRSATLAQSLGPMPVGDKYGTVVVEFNGGINGNSYSSKSVLGAYFIALPLEPSSKVPGCLW